MRTLSLRTAKSPRHLRIGLLLLLGGLLVASCGDTSAPGGGGGGGELDASGLPGLPEAGEGPRDASVETGNDGSTDGPREAEAEGGDGGAGDAGDAGVDGGPVCSTVLGLPGPPRMGFAWGVDVAVGDLDGDGRPDLAVAGGLDQGNAGQGGTTVLLNRGRGAFASPLYNPAPGGAGTVALGDLDGDGDLDMVTTAATNPYGTNPTVSTFLNDGTGTFGLPATYTIGGSGGPGRVALGDLNGDGKLDLAVAAQSPDTVNVLFNTGAGAFGPKTAYATAPGPRGTALGDFDGDGDVDIAVAARDAASVLLNNGRGILAPRVDYATPPNSRVIKAADVNGDSKIDLVVRSDTSVSVLMNAPGGFAPAVAYPTGAASLESGLGVADLNGDGKADLAMQGGLMMNNGDGTFAPQIAYDIFYGVGVGDFDGDGRLDVTDGVQVFWNNPGATFATTASRYRARGDYSAANTPTVVAMEDLDGDGDSDLAVADLGFVPEGHSAYITLNNGDGTYAPMVSLEVGYGPRSIAAGDVDGDGDVDLVSVREEYGNSNVTILVNNGTGTFADGVDYRIDVAFVGGSIAMGDLNGDGRPDLAISVGSGVNVLMNNGNGTFAAKVDYAAPPGTIALRDLNGDRKPDMAVAGAGGVTVFLNSGTGTFGAPLVYATTRTRVEGAPGTFLAVGDVDGDGDLDLAASGNDGADVLLNYGAGTFAPYVHYALPGVESAVGLGDLDGDGRPELAVESLSGLTVLRNNGDGTFGREELYETGGGPTAIAMSDLDRDGKLDVVTVGYRRRLSYPPGAPSRTSSVSVLLNSGLICRWR
ncbi:MAG: VCBS repeat-containing protein [Myxococcales bacterium]|nr:VCBS repeat-containing protein [Myxococcales bacterium]